MVNIDTAADDCATSKEPLTVNTAAEEKDDDLVVGRRGWRREVCTG